MKHLSAGRSVAAAAILCQFTAATAWTQAPADSTQAPMPRSATPPQASTEPAVNPGRPTVTDVANLTVPGYLEIETGLNYYKGGTGLDYIGNEALLLKLTDKPGRTEYRVGTNGYVIQKTTGGTAAVSAGGPNSTSTITTNSGTYSQGFGDTTFGVQHLFVAQTARAYNIAGRLEYKLPTAGTNVGTGKSDYNLLVLASKDYTDKLHIDYNAGSALIGRNDRSGYVTQPFGAIAVSYALPPHFTVQTELYGFGGNALSGTNVVSGYGFTYTPHPSVVYDGYIGFGLSHSAPKLTATVGRTFFLGKLF